MKIEPPSFRRMIGGGWGCGGLECFLAESLGIHQKFLEPHEAAIIVKFRWILHFIPWFETKLD